MTRPLARWDDGVFVTREDVHELGAFTWRGALPRSNAGAPTS
jgi:hypothetical protein